MRVLDDVERDVQKAKYAVEPREEYQEIFCTFLHACGFDMYGMVDSIHLYRKNNDEARKQGWFENDTFILRPFYWGEDERISQLPNFEFKPSGLSIWWYKYPMRGAQSNMDYSPQDLKKVCNICADTIWKRG